MTEIKIAGISNELKKKLTDKRITYVGARSSKLSASAVNTILESIKKKYLLNDAGDAIPVLAMLFQGGATARGCDGNMVISIYDKEFKLADIRKILKEASCNRAERKLARSLADQLHEVSVLMELDGNLYKKIQRTHLDKKFDQSEKSWMSDYQADNPNCPLQIRNLIVETFQSRKKNTPKKDK